jgi:hypothetical protein
MPVTASTGQRNRPRGHLKRITARPAPRSRGGRRPGRTWPRPRHTIIAATPTPRNAPSRGIAPKLRNSSRRAPGKASTANRIAPRAIPMPAMKQEEDRGAVGIPHGKFKHGNSSPYMLSPDVHGAATLASPRANTSVWPGLFGTGLMPIEPRPLKPDASHPVTRRLTPAAVPARGCAKLESAYSYAG